LNQIGLGFYESVLMFRKCPRTPIFPKLFFPSEWCKVKYVCCVCGY